MPRWLSHSEPKRDARSGPRPAQRSSKPSTRPSRAGDRAKPRAKPRAQQCRALVLAALMGLGAMAVLGGGWGDGSSAAADGWTLRSPAFAASGEIPARFTCAGEDVSPPLRWSAPPPHTRSLALTLTDPDAPSGEFIHWLLWNLPPTTRSLAAGVPPIARPPAGGEQGVNSFRRLGYGGPCPPGDEKHRYVFTLMALNTSLALPPGAGSADLRSAVRGHVLERAELTGRFGR